MVENFLRYNYEALILAGVFVLVLLWLGWRLRTIWKNFLFSLIRRRGRIGENSGVKLLEKNGYKIIDSQIPLSGELHIDGKPSSFNVRVDFLVERDGSKYLAEVKTGFAAATSNPATRRQLLEYTTLVETDNIILVDATLGTVKTIRFDN